MHLPTFSVLAKGMLLNLCADTYVADLVYEYLDIRTIRESRKRLWILLQLVSKLDLALTSTFQLNSVTDHDILVIAPTGMGKVRQEASV